MRRREMITEGMEGMIKEEVEGMMVERMEGTMEEGEMIKEEMGGMKITLRPIPTRLPKTETPTVQACGKNNATRPRTRPKEETTTGRVDTTRRWESWVCRRCPLNGIYSVYVEIRIVY